MLAQRKFIVWTFAILAFFVLSGTIATRILLDEERIKHAVSSKVQSAWGHKPDIGRLSLHLFPFPMLQAQDIIVPAPPWASSPVLLKAEQIRADLALWSILKGKTVITSLSVSGLELDLEVSPDGQRNWHLPASSHPAQSIRKPTDASQFPLSTLKIEDARISYKADATSSRTWQVEKLNASGKPGLRDVRIDARLLRDFKPMDITAYLADLSDVGMPGAVSEGEINLRWGKAHLNLTGKIPLEKGLKNLHMKASFEASELSGLLNFFGVKTIPPAPVRASASMVDRPDGLGIKNLSFNIGSIAVTGDAALAFSRPDPRFKASLAIDRLNWPQAMSDLGRPPLPPKPPGQLFRETPLPWATIAFFDGRFGRLELRINQLTTRSGMTIKNLKAQMDINGKRTTIGPFSFSMLGGEASGTLRLDEDKKKARLELDAKNVSLGEWLARRKSRLKLSGGPMDIKASVTASGNSMKELAASLNGPVNIRIGSAKLHSEKMQHAEALLTGLLPMLAAKDAAHIDLACLGAYLPFRAGRAESEPLVGMRSDASRLLMNGHIDLSKQSFEWKGKVKARSGISLGMSTLAGGDVKIGGKILAPKAGLDPASTPEAVARIGAAIATGGASILATAIWDATNPASDPCQIAANQHSKRSGKNEATRKTARKSAETQNASP